MKKKVILTGATGAIGLAILKCCNELQWDVCAMIRPGSMRNWEVLERYHARIMECDLSDIKKLCNDEQCRDADYFIHLGWGGTFGDSRNDVELQKANVQYALDACEVAAELGCKVFVFAGSQAEYGRVEGMLSGVTPTCPENEYGKAKLEAGMRTRLFCEHKGMRHIYVRILSVYGPGDGEFTMVSSTIRKLQEGISPEFTPGEQLWDYLYSEDAARALLLLCEKGKSNRIYCLGSGVERPLQEYIRIIGNIVNPEVVLRIGALPYGEKQVMRLCADISDLKEDTGFEPVVSFEEGIKKMCDES